MSPKSQLITLLTATLVLFFSCTSETPGPPVKKQSTQVKADTIIKDTTIVETDADTTLEGMNRSVLTALKSGNFEKFADFIHPEKGVRFSPYGYIDTEFDVKLGAKDFLRGLQSQEKLDWGNDERSGREILLTIPDYLQKIAYNADYLNADRIGVNESIGNGTSVNNLEEIYPDAEYIENYFAGFRKELKGKDWTALRLVFEEYHGRNYLTAVVRDQD